METIEFHWKRKAGNSIGIICKRRGNRRAFGDWHKGRRNEESILYIRQRRVEKFKFDSNCHILASFSPERPKRYEHLLLKDLLTKLVDPREIWQKVSIFISFIVPRSSFQPQISLTVCRLIRLWIEQNDDHSSSCYFFVISGPIQRWK